MIAALVLLTTAIPESPRDTRPAPRLCLTVHGRLMYTNGTPDMRIWVIGTRRILGVEGLDDTYDRYRHLPRNIQAKWDTKPAGSSYYDYSVYGDFRVCAWKPQRPEEMQMVRVMSGRNLILGGYR